MIIDNTWDHPVIFEAWGTIEDGASMITMKDQAAEIALLTDEVTIPLFSIRGTSWNAVMTIYHEINGWEPYRPMEDS